MKKIFITFIFLVVLFLLYVLNFPPYFVKEYIKNETENQIIKNINLYTKIEKVTKLKFGIFEQKAIAENIIILKGNDYRKEIFIKSRKIEISFNLISLLFTKLDNFKININLIGSEINLKRFKNGKFDINSPLFEIRETKQEKYKKDILLPSINILIRDAFINYLDLSFEKALRLNTNIKYLRLKIVEGTKVFYDTDIYDKIIELKLNGYFHLNKKYSNNGFQIKTNNISRIINTFINLKKYDSYISGGNLNLSGYISFDNLSFKNLKLNSDIILNNLIFKNNKFNAPININTISVNLTEKTINIKEFNLFSLGSTLNLNLNSNFSDKNNFFKVNFSGKNILLQKIFQLLKINIPIFTDINTNFSLEGSFKDFKKYNQFIKYPTNILLNKGKSYFEANNIKYQNIVTDRFSFNLNLNRDKIYLENINSNILNGNINGIIKISNFKGLNIKNSNINGKIFIRNIKLYKYFKVPKFLLNSEIKLSGKTINPKINFVSNIPSIDNYENLNINSDISYYDKNVYGTINSNSYYGLNKVGFELKSLDLLYLNLSLKKIPLKILNNYDNSINFNSGYFYTDLETKFSLKKLDKKNILNNNFFIKNKTSIKNCNFIFNNKKFSNFNINVLIDVYNKDVKSFLNIKSNKIDKVTSYISFNKNKDISLNLKINKLPLNLLNFFSKDIKFLKGDLDTKINLKTNIDTILKKDFKNIELYSVANIDNVDLKYKKIILNNIKGDLFLDLNKNLSTSNVFINSKQFNLISKINLFKSKLKGDFNINNLNIKYFNVLENINIKDGFVNIKSKFDTDINNIFNSLVLKTDIDLNNLSSDIKLEGKNFNLIIPSYRSIINYKNNYFVSSNKFNSDFIKEGNISFIINHEGLVNGNLKISSLDITKANIFLDEEDYKIKNARLDSELKFKFKYKDINSLIISGNTNLKDIKFNYFNKLYVKEKLNKNYIESNDIDLVKVNFNFKDNFLKVKNIKVNKNNSNLIGKLEFNIKDFTGNLLLKSNNIEFNDLKIFKIYGFNKGNFKSLYLNSSLNKDYKKVFSEIFFTIENISSNQTISGDISLNKGLLNINNIILKKGYHFLDISGKVNFNDKNLYIVSNSKEFSIKDLISLVPEKYINSKDINNLKILNIVYTLPNKKSDRFTFEDLLSYWEKNSLEPNYKSKKLSSENVDLISSIGGKLSSELIIKGKINNPIFEVKMLINDLEIYGRKISEMYLFSFINKEEVNLNKFYLLDKDGGYLELKGNYKNSNLNFKINGKINLDLIDTLIKKDIDLEGFHFIDANISGNINNPLVDFSFYSQDGGSFNKVYFDNFSINANLKNYIINLEIAKINSIGKEIRLNGIIPLDRNSDEMNVSAIIKDNNLGIIDLFTNQINWEKGKGQVFFNLQKNLYEPLITGKIDIFDSKVFVSSLGTYLDNLNLDVDINNNFIKINKANALFNDKPIDIIGQIDLVNYIPFNLKLKLFAEELKWQENGINLLAKTSLSITNTIDEPVIGGKVLLKKGEINFSLGSSSNKSKSKSKRSSFVSYNNLNIEIEKNTDFWVKSPFFEMRPYGSLNLVNGDLYNPIISGSIEIDKGNVFIINNQFNILYAKAVFGGKEFERELFPLNPEITLITNTRLINPRTKENTLIEAKITGELEDIPKNNVKFEFINKGGLKDEEIWTQIIGLNAAQQIIEETSSGNTANTLAKFATPYLSRALFNPLTSKVADLFSLDEFNVGLASDTISNPGVAISLTKPLFNNFSIGYNGIIRASNQAQYTFFARYKLSENFALRTSIDERQSISIQGEIGSTF